MSYERSRTAPRMVVFGGVFEVVFGVRCRGIKIELTFVTPFAGRN